jgi:tetratricopeptide (TPR) repeat protein
MELCNEDNAAEEIPRKGLQPGLMAMDDGQIFNPWLAVDIPGSPRLTGLIGALTLELCDKVADLDLSERHSGEAEQEWDLIDTDKGGRILHQTQNPQTPLKTTHPGVSFNIAVLTTHLSKEGHPRMLGPLDELSPFPRSGPLKRLLIYPRTDHLACEYSLKTMELECQIKLKVLKSMKRSDGVDLVESLRSIAHRHYELNHYGPAEIWWRRVVTCSLKIPGFQPFKVLCACLWVIHVAGYKGRLFEALNLHHGVHEKILNLVQPEHELAIFSNRILADLSNNFGDDEPALAIHRELLQISLLKFGARHTLTLELLLWLAQALNTSSQYRGVAETMLCIRVELDREVSSHAYSISVQNSLTSMGVLVDCLVRQRRYEDVKNVLDLTERRFKDLIRIETPFCWKYYYEKAKYMMARRRWHESEQILRGLLRHGRNYPDYDMMNSMQTLADLLMSTGRKEEAAVWLEKIFLMVIAIYGLGHKYSLWGCRRLGFCYAAQGRYDDAIHHFQQTIAKLAVCQAGDLDFRLKYIEDIQSWICEVEVMRDEAGTDGLENSTTLEGAQENSRVCSHSISYGFYSKM